jgi:capsular polysaccharide biosynthesis protein
MKMLVVAVVLAAYAVTWASLMQAPTYKASAHVLVGERSLAQEMRNGKIQPILNAPTPETLQALTQTMVRAIDSRPVAERTIQRLGLQMKPDELLDRLTVEEMEDTSFVVLTYEDTDPMKAQQIANTVAKVSERISERNSPFKAIVWEKAAPPESPVSPKPLRNGLLTLVTGLVLCAGTALALPGVGARMAGTLGERPSRQGIGQAGVLSRRHSDYSIVERVKEKKLLRAIGHRGKLTAVQAALDTSLSVEESRRILEELAFAGHLEVTVEHGKLLYSFWGDGA